MIGADYAKETERLDYLEGLFLGKLWSDTDFENRKHVGLFVLYGLLTDCVALYSYMFGRTVLGIGSFGTLHFALFLLLCAASPFICFRYYRMPFWGKILVLGEKALQSYLVLDLTVNILLPRLTVKSADLQTFAIDYLNKTLETYTDKFAGSLGSFSTVIGVLAGGLHVVLMVLLWLVAAIVIPGIVYLIYRFIQFCWDWLMNVLIIKRFIPVRR